MTRSQQQFRALVQAGLTARPSAHLPCGRCSCSLRRPRRSLRLFPANRARVYSWFTHSFKRRNPRRVPLLKPSTFVNFSSSFPNILNFFFLNLCSYLTFRPHHSQEHKSSNIILLQTSFWSLCFSVHPVSDGSPNFIRGHKTVNELAFASLANSSLFPSRSLTSALALCPAIRTP